jgi:ABC-type phosphate transport system substrate-binding protein
MENIEMKKLLCAFLLAVSASISIGHVQAQVIVIANPGVKSDSVSKSELREVFTGSSTNLKDGTHVKPVLLKDCPAHAEFASAYLGMGVVPLLIAWRGLVMSGQATMPKSFDSESAVVDYVSHTAGAIGYINKATPHDAVKVMSVH